MGYVTPVLLYNDSLHLLKEDPHFVENLYSACISSKEKDIFLRAYRKTWIDNVLKIFGLYRMPNQDKLRGSADFAQVLSSRHADTASTVVIWGNTWEEITTCWSKEEYASYHKGKQEYIKKCATIAEQDAKRVKTIIKEYEKEIKNEAKINT